LAKTAILAHQLKAARALARLDQQELSNRSGVSVPTIKRMEAGDGPIRGNYENVAAVVGALEAAGIEFIPENGGGPGARLRTAPATPTAPPPSASKQSTKTATAKKKRGRSLPDS
jgi:transcriptional regulator with XRE-family HTH domain